ncbi:MAG: hypothetical protein ACRETA_12680, partial [Gammaproteobacteria bacterium]
MLTSPRPKERYNASSVNKNRTIYICDACGGRSLKWAGQCPDCGAWNTLVEARAPETPARSRQPSSSTEVRVQRLAEVKGEHQARISTGLDELDRVLGG